MKSLDVSLVLLVALGSVGCGSSDPTGSGGQGTLHFTTWGEDYIEHEIPPDPGDHSGFVDGWTVKYDKFLVNFQAITVADSAGRSAAAMSGAMLFDNHVPGVKTIVDFPSVEAKAWDEVSYQIAPVTTASTLGPAVTEADRQMMADGGFAVYVDATATKDAVSKHYAWGFAIATQYKECHSEQDGQDQYGVVVKNNQTLEIQLTTHGDHLYYDRLQASPDPAVVTSLRFDDLAAADADDDGELTLDELDAKPIDVNLYDPSGLDAATQGAFVKALARTVGHFRGEGECSISAL